MKGKELTPHIGIFGRRNYGKSSLVNYLTGQDIAIVSDLAGTTTDPVKKTMEISGIGPVVWVDTAGIDDEGTVGRQRIERSMQTLAQCDLALILFTDNLFETEEMALVDDCRRRSIPFILICSQTDRVAPDTGLVARIEKDYATRIFPLSVMDPARREPLIELIRKALPATAYQHKTLLGDVVSQGDSVVMVTPIDSSAPEGRMILPQVQVLRDLLDNHATAVVCQPAELAYTFRSLASPPRLVVTDSQAFHQVREILDGHYCDNMSAPTPYLTSFSIVLARAKGLFEEYVKGTPAIDNLQDGDRVLMLESCSHNVTCEDIGRVKLPALLAKYTGKKLRCETLGGLSPVPKDIADYALVIQCGGCVITRQQLASRLQPALDAGVPVSNYGLALAYMNGIFHRSMEIFDKQVR